MSIHFNILITRHPDGPQTQEEKEWQERFKKEQRIEDGFPEILTSLEELEAELYIFAGLLQKFQVNERMAHTVLENEAKRTMKLISMSVLEEFAQAILHNNLEYFVEILDIPLTNTFDAGGISTAQRYIKNWIASTDKELIIPMQHFKVVYDVFTDNKKSLSIRDFSKVMNRINIQTTRKRMGEGEHRSAPRGVLITWVLNPEVKEALVKEHFDDSDLQLLTG